MTELIIFCLAVGVAATVLVRVFMPKGESKEDAIARRLEEEDKASVPMSASAALKAKKGPPDPMRSALKRSVPYLARPVVPTNEAEKTRLKVKLAQAGLRQESAAMIFLASKTALGLIVALVVLLATWGSRQSAKDILTMTIGLGAVAFLVPNYWLSRRISVRALKIKHALSDVLDMMVIMVEAGLGLDAAIQRAGQEMAEAYPELSEEMRVTNTEMNMGLRRAEALANLATRTGVKEVRILVAAIIQAERFGSGVARTLRVQANTLRVKRRQLAEEAAQKVAVKLIFPLVLFIFPALMIVVGGPALMGILESFGKF
ncbi:MAG TPA: type II secretion system F family protein [Phycisphaerae bacterium]|nr:type II secretion system F family protein [Phycisphaerae bacterium]